MPEKIIRKILNYSLLRPIGSGGMATVFEALDEKLGRKVAIKILHPHLTTNLSAVERFEREALSAAKLIHPNIVQVYDYFEFESDHCIVMEFVPGVDAESLVKREGGLGFGNTLSIMASVAEALAVAHKHGMIHRDVKPSNIMIRTDGRVMLADFGLVKGVLDVNLTVNNAVAGTPAFMAPEQISGKPLSAAVDIYAWGISFYFLLTGALPYTNSEFVNLVSDIKLANISVDNKVLGAMPAKYSDLLRRSFLVNSIDRPATGSELLKLLEPLPNGLSLDKTICCEEGLINTTSNFSTEKSIAKTVIARGGIIDSRAKYFAYLLFGMIIMSTIIVYKKRENNKTEKVVTVSTINTAHKEKISPTVLNNGEKRKKNQPLKANSRGAKISAKTIQNEKQPLVQLTDSTINREINSSKIEIDSGALFVFSEPWANVEVDGKYIGKTPLEVPVRVAAGNHLIVLYGEFTEEKKDTITIKKNEVSRKRYNLTLKQAYRK